MTRFKRKHRYFAKTIIWMLVSCIFFEIPLSASSAAGPLPAASQKALSFFGINSIPQNLGHTEEIHINPDSDKKIILIQDAHMNVSAQQNIAGLMKAVHLQNGNINNILMEAGFGEESVEDIRALLNQENSETEIQALLYKNLIQAPEAFALSSAQKIRLTGIESIELYESAANLYLKTISAAEQLKSYQAQMRSSIGKISAKILNPRLRVFWLFKRRYQAGNLPLTEYCRLLSSLRHEDRLEAEADDPIVRINRLKKIESRINFKRLNEELDAVRPLLSESGGDLAHADAVSSKNLSYIRRQLTDADFKAVDAAGNFPEIRLYREYVSELQNLDFLKITDSVRTAENSALQNLIKNEAESEFIRYERFMDLTDRMISLEANSREIEERNELKKNATVRSTAGWINRKLIESGFSGDSAVLLNPLFEQAVVHAERFYKAAESREDFCMNRIRSELSSDNNQAFLVIGGYHADRMKSLMKADGISYLSLQPNIRHETDHGQYVSALESQARIFSSLYESAGRPSLPEGLMTLRHNVNPELFVKIRNVLTGKSGNPTIAKADSGSGLMLQAARLAEVEVFLRSQDVPDPYENASFLLRVYGDDWQRAIASLGDLVFDQRYRDFLIRAQAGDVSLSKTAEFLNFDYGSKNGGPLVHVWDYPSEFQDFLIAESDRIRGSFILANLFLVYQKLHPGWRSGVDAKSVALLESMISFHQGYIDTSSVSPHEGLSNLYGGFKKRFEDPVLTSGESIQDYLTRTANYFKNHPVQKAERPYLWVGQYVRQELGGQMLDQALFNGVYPTLVDTGLIRFSEDAGSPDYEWAGDRFFNAFLMNPDMVNQLKAVIPEYLGHVDGNLMIGSVRFRADQDGRALVGFTQAWLRLSQNKTAFLKQHIGSIEAVLIEAFERHAMNEGFSEILYPTPSTLIADAELQLSGSTAERLNQFYINANTQLVRVADDSGKVRWYWRKPVGARLAVSAQIPDSVSIRFRSVSPELHDYLKAFGNSEETIKKLSDLLVDYPEIVLEVGSGRTAVASKIAKNNRYTAVIATDTYDDPSYTPYKRMWANKKLELQVEDIPNAVALRAGPEILEYLPDTKPTDILMVNYEGEAFRQTMNAIQRARQKQPVSRIRAIYLKPHSRLYFRSAEQTDNPYYFMAGKRYFFYIGSKFRGVDIHLESDFRHGTKNVYAHHLSPDSSAGSRLADDGITRRVAARITRQAFSDTDEADNLTLRGLLAGDVQELLAPVDPRYRKLLGSAYQYIRFDPEKTDVASWQFRIRQSLRLLRDVARNLDGQEPIYDDLLQVIHHLAETYRIWNLHLRGEIRPSINSSIAEVSDEIRGYTERMYEYEDPSIRVFIPQDISRAFRNSTGQDTAALLRAATQTVKDSYKLPENSVQVRVYGGSETAIDINPLVYEGFKESLPEIVTDILLEIEYAFRSNSVHLKYQYPSYDIYLDAEEALIIDYQNSDGARLAADDDELESYHSEELLYRLARLQYENQWEAIVEILMKRPAADILSAHSEPVSRIYKFAKKLLEDTRINETDVQAVPSAAHLLSLVRFLAYIYDSDIQSLPDVWRVAEVYLELNDNDVEDAEKAFRIFSEYDEIVFEIGAGHGNVALEIAEKNPKVGVVAIDVYNEHTGYNVLYGLWKKGKLKPQTANLDNLVLLRAEPDLLKLLPPRLISHVLLVNFERMALQGTLDILSVSGDQSPLKEKSSIWLKPFTFHPWYFESPEFFASYTEEDLQAFKKSSASQINEDFVPEVRSGSFVFRKSGTEFMGVNAQMKSSTADSLINSLYVWNSEDSGVIAARLADDDSRESQLRMHLFFQKLERMPMLQRGPILSDLITVYASQFPSAVLELIQQAYDSIPDTSSSSLDELVKGVRQAFLLLRKASEQFSSEEASESLRNQLISVKDIFDSIYRDLAAVRMNVFQGLESDEWEKLELASGQYLSAWPENPVARIIMDDSLIETLYAPDGDSDQVEIRLQEISERVRKTRGLPEEVFQPIWRNQKIEGFQYGSPQWGQRFFLDVIRNAVAGLTEILTEYTDAGQQTIELNLQTDASSVLKIQIKTRSAGSGARLSERGEFDVLEDKLPANQAEFIRSLPDVNRMQLVLPVQNREGNEVQLYRAEGADGLIKVEDIGSGSGYELGFVADVNPDRSEPELNSVIRQFESAERKIEAVMTVDDWTGQHPPIALQFKDLSEKITEDADFDAVAALIFDFLNPGDEILLEDFQDLKISRQNSVRDLFEQRLQSAPGIHELSGPPDRFYVRVQFVSPEYDFSVDSSLNLIAVPVLGFHDRSSIANLPAAFYAIRSIGIVYRKYADANNGVLPEYETENYASLLSDLSQNGGYKVYEAYSSIQAPDELDRLVRGGLGSLWVKKAMRPLVRFTHSFRRILTGLRQIAVSA